MQHRILLSLIGLTAIVRLYSYYLTPVVCRDPDVGRQSSISTNITFNIFIGCPINITLGGTTQNRDRKFLLIGSESVGAGIGNLLIFFPGTGVFSQLKNCFQRLN